MWELAYGPNEGDSDVVLWKSSEATARQDYATKVAAAPTEGYNYARLLRDGVVVQSWPAP